MTKAEWFISELPREMDELLYRLQTGKSGGLFAELQAQDGKAIPARKWRLLTCAFCRRFSEQVAWQELQGAVDLTERSCDHSKPVGVNAEAICLVANTSYAIFASLEELFPAASTWDETEIERVEEAWWLLRTGWCEFLREVFGNPFRPVSVEPSWLTPTVLALAAGIYAGSTFDHLPILADALQDAGCNNDDILSHLRSDGPHVKGCWALDLVLGKS